MISDTRRFRAALNKVAKAESAEDAAAIARDALNPDEAGRRRELEAQDARATKVREIVREVAITYHRLTFEERMSRLTTAVGEILDVAGTPIVVSEVSSEEIESLGGRALASPESLTLDEIRSLGGSVVSRATK